MGESHDILYTYIFSVFYALTSRKYFYVIFTLSRADSNTWIAYEKCLGRQGEWSHKMRCIKVLSKYSDMHIIEFVFLWQNKRLNPVPLGYMRSSHNKTNIRTLFWYIPL